MKIYTALTITALLSTHLSVFADADPNAPKKASIKQKGIQEPTSETLELKVLKVFAAKYGDAIYREYLVKWKDQEVVVRDDLAMTNNKEGDTITVVAMNCPYPEGEKPFRLQSFAIIPPPELAAEGLPGEALTRAADSATAKVDETERLELKVLKVFAAKDGDAIYRAYLVKWKDQEVVVSDELVGSNYKEGDIIGVLVINGPYPTKKKKSLRLLDFAILPPPAPTAEEVLEKAFKADRAATLKKLEALRATLQMNAATPASETVKEKQ